MQPNFSFIKIKMKIIYDFEMLLRPLAFNEYTIIRTKWIVDRLSNLWLSLCYGWANPCMHAFYFTFQAVLWRCGINWTKWKLHSRMVLFWRFWSTNSFAIPKHIHMGKYFPTLKKLNVNYCSDCVIGNQC